MDDPFQQVPIITILEQLAPVADYFGLILLIILVLSLLLLSALISGSEVAYFSLSPNDKEAIKHIKDKKNIILASLLERPKRLLATILIANNFVNVAIVIFSTYITNIVIGDNLSPTAEFIIQVVLITFLLLLLGEVIPKIYANKDPLKLAKFVAFGIYYLRFFLSPFSSILVNSTNFIDKRIKKKGHSISVDELSKALELTSDDNDRDDEQRILEGIVKFGNTDVKQVMTSRVDVISIEESMTYKEVIELILDSGYSRIPVHKENFDSILGVLYIKDLLPHLHKDDFKWKSVIRKPFFVPENKKIDDLLREFQSKKIHLAIVVDEYGGSSGIISLEDILEEIVGEISDEFDEDDITYSKLDDYTYAFEGKTPLNDFYRILNIEGTEFEAKKGDSDTLAGFVLEIFGKIPQKNEKIKFFDYQIVIEAADKRRVKRVLIKLPKDQVDKDKDK